MTRKQIERYLERIGLSQPITLDLAGLTQLQRAHQSVIPFENLDIMTGFSLSLDRTRLYEKMIIDRRGGICSELNTLYNWLLESLGFDVVSFNSRIIAKNAMIQPRTHRVLCVQLGEERYLTDVGFNYEHHRDPLLLKEGLVQSDGCCNYRLEKDEFWGGVMWQERPGMGWRQILGFTEERQIDADFILPTFYAQYHPDSRINKFLKISLYDKEQPICYAIRSGYFYIEKNGVEQVAELITSQEHSRKLLREQFGLMR